MNLSWRFWLRIVAIVLMLCAFYSAGLSWEYILILGLIFIVVIFLRGKLYRKIDHLLKKHFKFMSKIKKPWVEKLIIVVVFIIVYMVIRELIYIILGLFGIDVQHALTESINNTGKFSG